MAKNLGSTVKSTASARKTIKETGPTDFTTEDYKLRLPGSFEKGVKPKEDSSDENFKNLEG